MHDDELLWLTRVILFHDATTDYRFRAVKSGTPPPGEPGYPIPPRKSLFGKGGARGLPIGNLTSQFWANVYLDVLDQFVKRELRCRHYVRYVDDLILLSRDADVLARWRVEIEQFLRERLRLELRAGVREIRPVGDGVDVVGWRTWWNRRLVRRRTLGNLSRALGRFEQLHLKRVFSGAARRLDLTARARPRRSSIGRCRPRDRPTATADLRDTLASYAGHLRHGATWSQWGDLWSEHAWLRFAFSARDGGLGCAGLCSASMLRPASAIAR